MKSRIGNYHHILSIVETQETHDAIWNALGNFFTTEFKRYKKSFVLQKKMLQKMGLKMGEAQRLLKQGIRPSYYEEFDEQGRYTPLAILIRGMVYQNQRNRRYRQPSEVINV